MKPITATAAVLVAFAIGMECSRDSKTATSPALGAQSIQVGPPRTKPPILAGRGTSPATNASYSDGNWTPTITGLTSGSGQTYSTQLGYYVKIGRHVTVWLYLVLTAKGTITGQASFGGLPFTSAPGTYYPSANVVYQGLATTWTTINALVQPSTTLAALQGETVASVSNNLGLAATDIANTTIFSATITYESMN